MKARTKFLIGGMCIMLSAGYLMAASAKETAVYYLTPTELQTKLAADPSFRDVGMKVGAKVVLGSMVREPGGRVLRFEMTDGTATYPVVYRGVPPDTFTDKEETEVVVTGRLDEQGVFQATELLAKCASRFESVPGENGVPATGGHPDGVPKYPGSYGAPSTETAPAAPATSGAA